MKKFTKQKYIALIILLASAGSYFLFFSGQATDEIDQVVTYEHQVIKGRMADTLFSSVNATARNKVDLTFGLSGEIAEILVSTGDVVEKNQVIAVLESSGASRQVEVKKLLLSQQKASLEDLLADPAASELASAKQATANAQSAVANAEFNLKTLKDGSQASAIETQRQAVTTAKFNLENLVNPSVATIASSDSAVKNAKTAFERAKNDEDELWPKLIKAQEDYCQRFQDWVAVCNVGDIPLSDAKVKGLHDSLTLAMVPQGNQRTKTEALLTANANYVDAVNSVSSTEAGYLSAQESNYKLKNPSELEIQKLKEALNAAEVRLTEYLSSPEQLELDKLNAALDSANANLDYALARELELTAGALVNEINRKEQDVRIAELNLIDAETNLKNHTLTAPFAGIVGAIDVTLGQRIGSSTAVTTLSDPKSIYIEIPASESDLNQMQVGNLGIATFEGMPEQFYIVKLKAISAIPNITQGIISYPAEGKILTGQLLMQEATNIASLQGDLFKAMGFDVTAMSGLSVGRPTGGAMSGPPGGRPTGGTMSGPPGGRPTGGAMSGPPGGEQRGPISGMGSLAGQFINPKLPLDGMSGTLTLVTNIQQDVLLVPSNAITRVGRDNTVKLKNIDGSIEQIVVQTGNDDGQNTLILDGLKENDTILIEVKKSNSKSGIENSKPATAGGRPSGPFGGGPR
ncbi:MAG: hypothetical protein CL710_02920 [Chloroflexi bacterium]|mgnify:CR=1 FL=1|nr:hypothetical protein [Chloroflexota bacterium]|tara:strand:+ start:57190 stop:59259 length:2070 start_codon:yes stop_codon:yes gene_type:complete